MDEVDELLNLYGLEELFEVLDITPREVLLILLEGGHIVVPEFLERREDESED